MAASQITETTALLNDATAANLERAISRGSLPGFGFSGSGEEFGKPDPDFETTWKLETKLLFKYSGPLVMTYLLQYSYSIVTVFVAGRLGTDELGAASLASMVANITGLSLYEALATSLDTLTSQAYGAGKKKLVGLHLQRMIALVLVTTIFIGAVWICSPWILAVIVPEKKLAHLAGNFLRVYLIGAPGYGIFEAGKRFTQAQGNFTASLIPTLVCAPLNVLWNWLFVFHFNGGFMGAAAAVALSNTLQPIVFVIYINLFARETLECWPSVSITKSFQGWGPMIKLALPGVMMIVSEWLAFDILTFSSSYLSTAHLAAQSVLMTVAVTMYHLPLPFSIAASTRFGNLIGYGALKAARTAWKTYYLIFIGIGLMDIVLLTSLRHVIALIFTKDEVVREILVATLPVIAAVQMVDATTAVSNGLLRGLGRQAIGGWVNTITYYVFAIPLSLFLTFGPPKLELPGLWVGPGLGLGIVTVTLFIYMRMTDWSKAVDEARARGE